MADILIKGMKMPESCWNCHFFHKSLHYIGDDELLERHTCLRTGERTDESVVGYLKNCPIFEILPHGRLIDADEFVSCMTELVQIAKADGFDLGVAWYTAFIRHIELAPTVIPASEEVKDNA